MKNMNQETTKKCAGCGKELPLSSFGIDKRRKDGHKPCCKHCYNAAQERYHSPNRKLSRLEKSVLIPTGNHHCSPLSSFTDTAILKELARRGYNGKFTQMRCVSFEITGGKIRSLIQNGEEDERTDSI